MKYFKTPQPFSDKVYEEKASYDSTQFVSDIGGSAGLILGISGNFLRKTI